MRKRGGGIRIPYYRVIGHNGFWEPNSRMKAVGFSSVPCGPDGPDAWALAQSWNERWQAHRATRYGKTSTFGTVAELGQPAPKHGYVYFLWIGDRIKIGFSVDPFRRSVNLKIGFADKPTAFVCVRGSVDDERCLHVRFRSLRVTGEWFMAAAVVIRVMTRSLAFGRVDLSEPETAITPPARLALAGTS